MSSFGQTEIEYFGDRNDKVRPLLYKKDREVLLNQKRHEPWVYDVYWFNTVSYNMDDWGKTAQTLACKTHIFSTIV